MSDCREHLLLATHQTFVIIPQPAASYSLKKEQLLLKSPDVKRAITDRLAMQANERQRGVIILRHLSATSPHLGINANA